MEVDQSTAAAKLDYNGTIYYFCAPGCLQVFTRDPKQYLDAQEVKWNRSTGMSDKTGNPY
jgi:YHS domain-containing protein